MKKINLHPKPMRVSDLSFDDLYDEISKDWEDKSKKLQARRWHAINHGH